MIDGGRVHVFLFELQAELAAFFMGHHFFFFFIRVQLTNCGFSNFSIWQTFAGKMNEVNPSFQGKQHTVFVANENVSFQAKIRISK